MTNRLFVTFVRKRMKHSFLSQLCQLGINGYVPNVISKCYQNLIKLESGNTNNHGLGLRFYYLLPRP